MSRLNDLLAIRPGEGLRSGLVIGVMLLTAAGSALGGTGIEALFFARFGVEYLPHMFFGLGLMNMLTSFIITASLSRVSRSLLYVYLPAILAAVIVVARLALVTGWIGMYPVLWLGKEILNTLIGLLVWGLANMACDTRQAKRLFPLFNASRILGAVVGGFLTGALVNVVGTENLLLVWAGTMIVTFLLSGSLVRALQSVSSQARPPRRMRVNLAEEIRRGFREAKKSPLLRWVAIASVLFSILYFSIALPFSRAITERYPNENELAGFLGLFNGVSTAAAFLASLFLANRLFAKVGIMASLVVFPIIYLAGFASLALLPVFAVVVAFRFAQTLWLSGIADPAYQAMFNVIPSERRDRARTFIDGIPGQAGIMLAGLILIVGEQTLEPRQLYLVGLATAALCTYVLWQARRGYNEELLDALRLGRQTFFFNEAGPFSGFGQDAAAVNAAVNALDHPEPTMRLIATEALGAHPNEANAKRILPRLRDADPLVRAAAARAIGAARLDWTFGEISACLQDREPIVRLEALNGMAELAQRVPAARKMILSLLEDPDPRVGARAAVAILKHPHWLRGPASKTSRTQAAMRLFELARAGELEARAPAIQALGEWKHPDSFKFLTRLLRTKGRAPAVRNAINRALADLDPKAAIPHLIEALRDPDRAVRSQAASILGEIGEPALAPVLAAVNKSTYQDGALAALDALPPPPQDTILKLIRTDVAITQEYDSLMRSTSRARAPKAAGELRPADALLVEALRLKTFEHGTRAVRALGLLSDRDAIGLAVDQLHSRNPASRAAALEVIDSHDGRWNNILRPVLNAWEDQNTARTEFKWDRLLADPDSWVRACAAYAARTTRDKSLQRQLGALARNDADPFVRDAASPKGKKMKTSTMLSLMDRILYLKRVPMFQHLPPSDLKQVAMIAEEASFKDGEVLAEQGEQGDVLYIIVEGEIVVSAADSTGRSTELARRRAGEYVGEMAILTREPRMATLVSSGQSYVLTIDQKSFGGLLRERPDVSLALIQELSARLKQNTDLIEQLRNQT